MKAFILIALAALSYLNTVHGKIGTFSCKSGYPEPDAAMQKTLGVTCQPDMNALPMDLDPTKGITLDLLGAALGPQFKCIFEHLKAVDAKGKLIAKTASTFATTLCKSFSAKIKPKIDACVTKHNPDLKKEATGKGKSWAKFAVCTMTALDTSCAK